MTIEIPKGYETLGEALAAAVDQAAAGKGAGRHSYDGELFSDQLIFEIPRRLGEGGECFCLGQAAKKIYESRRLGPAHARAELLGAVNYLAAAWRLLGGGESVSAPESPKAAGNVCLEFSERVVSLMKELGVREVSFAGPGARICADGIVTGLRFTTEDFPSGEDRRTESVSAPEDADAPRSKEELVRRIREVNPAVYPQEDADMPRFQKGELVEYRSDGTWKPAAFMYMDGGYAVLVSGGEKVEVFAFNVRPAEKS